MSLLHWLDYLDKVLFILIHNDSDRSLWDKVMPVLRNPLTWIPVYLFIIFYVIKKSKNIAWHFIVISVLTVCVTDFFSSRIFKPLFARLRPCCEPQLQGFIRGIVDCGGVYSFPSSHAANHFGLAAFWYWSILLITGKKWNWLWIWATLICYAQIYVGKHYPLDVVAGAVLGYVVGGVSAKIFHKWVYARNTDFGSILHKPANKPVFYS